MTETRDKHGRAMKEGDVLRVFHFIGARRKPSETAYTIGQTNDGN